MSVAIKTCPACDQINPAVHEYCPTCGAALDSIERRMAPWTFAERFPPLAEAVRPDRRRLRRRPPEVGGVGFTWVGFILVAIPVLISTRSRVTDISWGLGIASILFGYWQMRRDPGTLARAGVVTNGLSLLVLGILGAKVLMTAAPDDAHLAIALAPTATNTPDWEGSPTPPAVDNDVAMYLGNPAHTGEMPGPGISGRPKATWRFDAAGELYSSPAVVNGILYVGTKSGFIYALDATTGAERWRKDLGDFMVRSSPAVIDNHLYIGVGNTLYDLNAQNGKEIWKGSTSFSGSSSAAVVDGMVYVASQSSVVYAFDAASGALKWSYPTDGPIFSSPSFFDGMLLFGTDSQKLIALDAKTGQVKWRFDSDGGIFSSPAVEDGTAYVTTRAGKTFALSLKTGKAIWSYDAGGDASPVVAAGVVYVGDQHGGVYALDARQGTVIWLKPTGTSIAASPSIANRILYVASGSTLYALDTKTGEELWRYAAGYVIETSPVIVNGFVYIGGHDGYLDAISGDGSS
jgi:outer membrane protein assembly factor BamB